MGLGGSPRWLEEASRVTGVDVGRAIERGGRALARTEVLQPALVAVGLAAAEGRAFAWVGGHSLGELTAACWAADLPPREALALAALRGRRMAELAAAHPGGMVAVDEAAAEGPPPGLEVAAINAPGEVVLTGPEDALAGVRGRRLRTAGPWHSAALRPMIEELRDAVRDALRGRRLRARVVSAAEVGEVPAERLADVLAESVARPVRWLPLVGWLEARGVRRAHLVEPARTTRALLRRAAKERWTLA